MSKDLKPGIYRHYKGNHYQVIGIASHSETHEPLALYQKLYGDYGLWVSPLAMFMETITLDGKTQPRFEYLGPIGTDAPHLRNKE